MTHSKTRKRELRKIRSWRHRNGILECQECGKPFGSSIHHYYCNKCYQLQRNAKKTIKSKKYNKIKL